MNLNLDSDMSESCVSIMMLQWSIDNINCIRNVTLCKKTCITNLSGVLVTVPSLISGLADVPVTITTLLLWGDDRRQNHMADKLTRVGIHGYRGEHG